MTAPASGPESFGPRRTAQGTIVGMPPVVREPVRLGQLGSITLRSVYKAEEGPCSDAFHPDRWSTPPATDLAPIVPCEEPEEEESVQVLPRLAAEPLPASEPVLDVAPVSEPEAPEPPTERWQPKAAVVADEPVVLPFREREPSPERRFLVIAATASATLLSLLVVAALVWG